MSIRSRARTALLILAIVLISFAIICWASKHILRCFPNSADEYIYLLQAESFLKARIWHPAFPKTEFFWFALTSVKEGYWAIAYYPGWALMLAIGMLIRLPPCYLNPLSSCAIIVIFYLLAKKLLSSFHSVFLLIFLLICSSFFILNQASYFNHPFCLLFILSSALLLEDLRKTPANLSFCLLGLSTGAAFTTRPITALACLTPLLLSMLRTRCPTRNNYISFIVGILPFLLIYLTYNYLVTGSPFVDVVLGWRSEAPQTSSFQTVSWQDYVRPTVQHFSRLVIWTNPAAIVLFFYLILRFPIKINRYDVVFLLNVAFYAAFPNDGGNQYGPRYYYEAYPFLLLSVLKKVDSLPLELSSVTHDRRWFVGLLYIGMIFQVVQIPNIFRKERIVILERMDLYDQISSNNIHNALILLESGTGVVRPMPIEDLLRNSIDYQQDVLYARSLGPDNVELIKDFPSRSIYRYSREPERSKGRLTLVHPPGTASSAQRLLQ